MTLSFEHPALQHLAVQGAFTGCPFPLTGKQLLAQSCTSLGAICMSVLKAVRSSGTKLKGAA